MNMFLVNVKFDGKVGKDQENAQSERDSPRQQQRWEKTKTNQQPGPHTMKTYRKTNEQLFSQ